MKVALLILNIIALIASLIWLMTNQSLEPLITAIGLIASLITIIYSSNKDSTNRLIQKGGRKSTNYQAGGNINVKIENDKR